MAVDEESDAMTLALASKKKRKKRRKKRKRRRKKRKRKKRKRGKRREGRWRTRFQGMLWSVACEI